MKTADIIVIGGGIAGISAAAELAAHRTVILLEAEKQLGYHSTGRSAAIFIRNYGNSVLRALNDASAPLLEKPDHLQESCLLSPRGEMLIATEEELPDLEEYMAGATGIESLTAAQAIELVPILRADTIAGAIIEWDARDIDVDRLLSGYTRLLKSRGGEIITEAPVQSLSQTADHIWSVTTAQGIYQAPVVINAAGAWAGEVGKMVGAVSTGLQPMRRSAALLPAPDGYDISKWPLFASASEQWYAKPDAGKLMVSPADETPVDPHDAWPDDMILAEGLHRYEQAVTIPVTRVDTSWAGLRSFTSDRSPVVGFDPQVEGFFWLAGQGGYGVQTAPALAGLVASLITKSNQTLDPQTVQALNPKRFL